MTQPAGLLRGMFAGLALIAAAPLVANVKAGVDAWTRGDFAAAVAAWQEPAAKGDADAQFNLGQAYKLGRGVKQDMVKAEELFAKAASQGHLQASDNYGLMLFQRGERAKALPFVSAAADRGDPRAQYLLGIAHFNGDTVAKDWVRAYALMSLAQQAGLPQAPPALAQMDQHIPVSDRQKSVSLAQEIAAQAEATRARQLASADLGNTVPGGPRPTAARPAPAPAPAPAVVAANPAPAPVRESPGNAGADYAKPRPAVAAAAPKPAKPAKPPVAAPIVAPRPVPPVASGGSWRIQLGAFGVTANADALWNKVRSRPELAGRTKHLVPGGSVTRLQAGGFASEAAARSACTRLSAAGFGCIAVGG
jgi:cell division septation protein DedD